MYEFIKSIRSINGNPLMVLKASITNIDTIRRVDFIVFEINGVKYEVDIGLGYIRLYLYETASIVVEQPINYEEEFKNELIGYLKEASSNVDIIKEQEVK